MQKIHRADIAIVIISIVLMLVVIPLLGLSLNQYKNMYDILNKQYIELHKKYMDLINQDINDLRKENEYHTKIKKNLIKWVYENSSRISMNTAIEIVDKTLKMKNSTILLSLFQVESGFDPTCLSKAGAMGLGQIMPVHIQALIKAGAIKEKRDLFNIDNAIKAANFVWEIKWKEGKGNIRTALAKYFGKQEKKYSDRVIENYFIISNILKGE